MDPQETDGHQAVRKIPPEQLSKEELLKKYRQAILIAQKAKEAKAEYLRHLAEHEKVIKMLEEKLLQAEKETRKFESKRHPEEQSEVRESNQERTVEESSHSKLENNHVENLKLLSELESSKDDIKSLELELSSIKNDLVKLLNVKEQLEKSVTSKDNEIKSLKIIKNEENLLWKKNNEELTSKVLQLEESVENERRYHTEQFADLKEKVGSLQEMLLNKDEVIKRQENQIKSMEFYLEQCKNQLDEKEILLESVQKTNSDLTSQLEELKKISQDQSSNTVNSKSTIENGKLEQDIGPRDEEIRLKEDSITSLTFELQEAKDNLEKLKIEMSEELQHLKKNEEVMNQTLSETFAKIDHLQSENDTCSQLVRTVQIENTSLSHQLSGKLNELKKQEELEFHSKCQIEEIGKELSEKKMLLKSSEDIIQQLQSKVTELNIALAEQATDKTVTILMEKKDSLEQEILQRDNQIHLKDEIITSLEKDIEELKVHINAFTNSTNQLEEVKMELLEKTEQLKQNEGIMKSLELKVTELTESLPDQASVEDLKKAKTNLEQEIFQRDDQINLKDEIIASLNSKLEEFKGLEELSFESKHQLEIIGKELSEKSELLSKREDAIIHLESKISELKAALSEQANTVTELMDKKTSLEQEILQKDDQINFKDENIASLNKKLEELQNQEEYISQLKNQLDTFATELSQKVKLLKQREDTAAHLELKVTELTASLSELARDNTFTELMEIKTILEQEVLQKNEEVQEKDETIEHLTLNLRDLEEQLRSSKLTEIEFSDKLETITADSEDLKQKVNCIVKEKENLISQLEETNRKLEHKDREICQVQAKLNAAAIVQQELREQLSTLQDTLYNKESALQELEQEVSKLREFAANESTNTEVSSTFSLSRAEEHSRLRDLEDSFEDKYTKLRVVAVKLKKRLTDLNQTLESERSKMASEKSELQARLSQLASSAKTVQTLQSEVDRLQDLLEEEKKIQRQLNKDLECAVREVTSTKSELASLQEEFHRIVNEKQTLEAANTNLEAALSHTGALSSETERLGKESKAKDLMLETLKEEKQKLAEQLEKVCADIKKKSVLSLEMADMEKSVSELTRQLSMERDRLKSNEEELEKEHSLLLSLQEKSKKLEDQVEEKDTIIQQLKDLLSASKEENYSSENRCKEKEMAINQLSMQLEKQRSLLEELNLQCSDLAAKQVQIKETSRLQIEALNRQVFQLEEQCSTLQDSNKALEDELNSVRTEFENYKVRAQSVLRQSTKQEERVISSSTLHDAEELEVEVERLRVNLSNVKANLNQTTSQLQAALQEINVEREERIRATKLVQSSKDACAQAIERQHAAEERLSALLEEIKQAKLHSDMLVQCYKQQLEDLKTTHQKKIATLTERIENLQASVNNHPSPRAALESDQPSHLMSGNSPVSEWTVHLPNPAHSDSDLSIRLSSLQREEGEGSESVDSFPSRRISVTSQERRHELVPLEKLLSSPTCPEDDSVEVVRANSSDLNVDLLQSKLSACESRAAHLTALLSEAESDAARLSQLNAVLKEEIRRQQRSEEREQHAHNLEYLKNIVVKFITLQNGDERQRLVPVLNTILKLSPDEAGLVASVAKGTSQANTSSRGWGSYLPLPGWPGS